MEGLARPESERPDRLRNRRRRVRRAAGLRHRLVAVLHSCSAGAPRGACRPALLPGVGGEGRLGEVEIQERNLEEFWFIDDY